MKRNSKKKKVYSSEDDSDVEISHDVKSIAKSLRPKKKTPVVDVNQNEDSDIEFVADRNKVKRKIQQFDN